MMVRNLVYPKDITQLWIDWVVHHTIDTPAVSYAQERKFMGGLILTIPQHVWEKGLNHKFVDLGYSAKGSKTSQLMKNYYNAVEVAKAREILKQRKTQSVTSIGISTIGQAKTSLQGHCIRGLVVNYHSPRVRHDKQPYLSVDVLYRTTELLRKFGADLVFLREFLIPEVLKDNPWGIKHPNEVRMYFSSCFFSALFIPVLYGFTDPIGFLERLIEAQDGSMFYRRCVYRTKTMLERNVEHYKFASRKNMAKFAHDLFSRGKIDKQKLTRFLNEEEIT